MTAEYLKAHVRKKSPNVPVCFINSEVGAYVLVSLCPQKSTPFQSSP